MSDTTIRPALTPEEWADTRAGNWFAADGSPLVAVFAADTRTTLFGQTINAGDLLMPDALEVHPLAMRERQQLAALCLHGHPQGFTREDVAMARRLATYRQASMRERMLQAQYGDAEEVNRARNEAMAGDQGGLQLSAKYRAWLESIAARIEALLPPEGA